MSYLTLKHAPNPSHNIIVLNSVTNLSKAAPFIASHEQVYAYLDNDDAGRKATAGLKPVCRNLSDQSVHYRPHNDLNDYLRSRWPNTNGRVVASYNVARIVAGTVAHRSAAPRPRLFLTKKP